MRIRRPQRGTIALLGALAAIAAVLGFAATPAHALTATDKGAIYKYCRAEGYSRTYCCKAAGGYWSSASSTCEFVDDPMGTNRSDLSTSPPTYAIPPTGADTSSTSSGGASYAGTYGLVVIYDPEEIIP